MDVVMLLGGGILLYFGAEWLVAGAAGLARSMGVSALLVGLTVVAYGTSAPEIIVGVQASFHGHRDIALGNVVGSNIANLGLILGATALYRPTPVSGTLRRRELPVLFFTALAVPLSLLDGLVSLAEGVVLLLIALGYTVSMAREAGRGARAEAQAAAEATAEAADIAGAPSTGGSKPRLGLLALAGLATLVVGGRLLVEGATGVAQLMGISERVVGLTIVAVGTSLPELATCLIAASRGHSDIAVGNVVGSNIFNVLLCLGAAAVAGPVGAPLQNVAWDVGCMVAITLMGMVAMRTQRKITRVEGAVLIAGYVVFNVGLLFTGGTGA